MVTKEEIKRVLDEIAQLKKKFAEGKLGWLDKRRLKKLWLEAEMYKIFGEAYIKKIRKF